jgi:hypothetical protein
MQIDVWLKSACDDAERRGLPELKPLLETLARSTAALREADPAHRALAPGQTDTSVAAGAPATSDPARRVTRTNPDTPAA